MNSICLLDVNVLIALAWPSHIHHTNAQNWFAKHSRSKWATCPLTQCGFVRISSNPKIIAEAVSVQNAIGVLRQITSLKNHVFWADEISLEKTDAFLSGPLYGHRQVTDAYLLALAVKKGGKLVSLDHKILSLLSDTTQQKKHVELIPV